MVAVSLKKKKKNFFFFFFFYFFFFFFFFFFFKQKTAYEIVVRDWSSDVCSSDLGQVFWEGRRMDKAGASVPEEANLEIRGQALRYVKIGRASCRERVSERV